MTDYSDRTFEQRWKTRDSCLGAGIGDQILQDFLRGDEENPEILGHGFPSKSSMIGKDRYNHISFNIRRHEHVTKYINLYETF
jgi:hypothetical protein